MRRVQFLIISDLKMGRTIPSFSIERLYNSALIVVTSGYNIAMTMAGYFKRYCLF